MTQRRRWALIVAAIVQLLATTLTMFIIRSWAWVSWEVECSLREYPFLMHTPGAWFATHGLLCLMALVLVGNVMPLLLLSRMAEPWPAITTQLACSGTQVLLALVAWMSILSGLEAVFHEHNCYCPDAPAISSSQLELAPEPPRSTHGWHGCR